jgi:hypothetical protein
MSSAGNDSVSSRYSYTVCGDASKILGFDPTASEAIADKEQERKRIYTQKVCAITTFLFMTGEGDTRNETGWKVPTVREYLKVHRAEMVEFYPITNTITSHDEALAVIAEGPHARGWLEIVRTCGEYCLSTEVGKGMLTRKERTWLGYERQKQCFEIQVARPRRQARR